MFQFIDIVVTFTSDSESEILASDSFQLGKDIEKFYELHQQLSMDDLARRKVMHTKVHLVRVLSKVIRNLENPEELDTYLRCIGRLHQLAGVDSSYLSMSGKSFCDALDSIEQHKELWSKQVSSPGPGGISRVRFNFSSRNSVSLDISIN